LLVLLELAALVARVLSHVSKHAHEVGPSSDAHPDLGLLALGRIALARVLGRQGGLGERARQERGDDLDRSILLLEVLFNVK
jgi:hypothetical protein